jgi:hypothetical protein
MDMVVVEGMLRPCFERDANDGPAHKKRQSRGRAEVGNNDRRTLPYVAPPQQN